MKNFFRNPLLLLATVAAPSLVRADVKPNSLFSDGAVLQREKPVAVWGTADEGERVTVSFAGQNVSTVARKGQWMVKLAPLKASSTPASLTVTGRNTVVLKNILVGEVWIASGQSNMERQLGPRGGQKELDNWREEAAAADFPLIREYYVPQKLSLTAKSDVDSTWTVCSPQSAPNFSAVGFFFARALHQKLGVPVGIIFSAWGGTPAESWTSGASLKTMPDFQNAVANVEAAALEATGAKPLDLDAALNAFFAAHDPGSAPGKSWAAPTFEATNWKSATGTVTSEAAGAGAFDGILWTRREIELSPDWNGKAATLRLGTIDDNDTAFVNGVQIGATQGWTQTRNYAVPAGVLRAGRNVIAVRVVDTGGGGGFYGDANALKLESVAVPALPPVALAGDWKFQPSTPLSELAGMPARVQNGTPSTPTVLYNGMIAPLVPVAMRGVIWYQGEANDGRAAQYQTLFPLLVSDWRRNFGQGNFPFLFVQIAPFNGMSPEIREAQLLSLRKTQNTAMVVTTDVGDAADIHPTHKAPVGERLALAARALAYGEKTEYSGPLYAGVKIEGNSAVVSFSHAGGGLVAKDGPLRGFTIAGADGKFVPASAQIVGNSVVVSSGEVTSPVAVRYGWANVPDVNLFGARGLPASPFRTDDGAPAPR